MNSKIISQNILKELPERTREVILRRFALGKNSKPETLESIGKSFKITRERVRQIENDGIKKSKKIAESSKEYNEIIAFYQKELQKYGGVVKEDNINKENKNYSIFLISLTNKIIREKENDNFYSFWSLNKESTLRAKEIIKKTIKELKEVGCPREIKNFPIELEISKDVLKTYDGKKMGLSSWPEVNPKTVKDKIKLILNQQKKPIHFKEVAEMISNLPQKRNLHPQTIHNELIRNKNFVLVGRGYYALKDWGYNPGQVRDVIYQVLSVSGDAMPKEEIINSVLNQRMVKESTILLNLQNKKFFKRDEEGKYKIKEA
ncbi:MAG: sigma factor-like helix-turn-helix DNA-binding protein [Candidatus Paceibacterota bacterium]|jgi:hypothetical protein